MRLDNKQIIEILSAAAVVASLVFVGLQLMFDRNVAIGEQYQLRAQSALDTARAEFQNDEWIKLQVKFWEQGSMPPWWTKEVEDFWNNGPATLGFTNLDLARISERADIFFIQQDNNYFQFQNGLLDEEVWLNYRESIKNNLDNPLYREKITSQSMRSSMRMLVDQLIQEIESGQ